MGNPMEAVVAKTPIVLRGIVQKAPLAVFVLVPVKIMVSVP
jgi:hypothetical protein